MCDAGWKGTRNKTFRYSAWKSGNVVSRFEDSYVQWNMGTAKLAEIMSKGVLMHHLFACFDGPKVTSHYFHCTFAWPGEALLPQLLGEKRPHLPLLQPHSTDQYHKCMKMFPQQLTAFRYRKLDLFIFRYLSEQKCSNSRSIPHAIWFLSFMHPQQQRCEDPWGFGHWRLGRNCTTSPWRPPRRYAFSRFVRGVWMEHPWYQLPRPSCSIGDRDEHRWYPIN